MVDVEGLPRPILETGPLKALPPADPILAWGETPKVSLSRRGGGALSREAGEGRGGGPLHYRLWTLEPPRPEAAAAVHHRAFCLHLAESLNLALPGARLVESLPDLDRLLAAPGAPRAWVVKAPLSAAGRDRYVERNGPDLTDPAGRRAIAGLFARLGNLLFEPWMDRTADFGCSVLLGGDGAFEVVSFHAQAVDRRGQFAGIELGSQFQGFAGLDGEEEDRMRTAIEGTARALAAAGYRGPFGIDAWRYRTGEGTTFHPLGEINARLTFGLVARALVDRLREPLGLAPKDRVRLAFGRALPETGLPLVTPGRDGGLAIWLERMEQSAR
jgi:hypothetical protein